MMHDGCVETVYADIVRSCFFVIDGFVGGAACAHKEEAGLMLASLLHQGLIEDPSIALRLVPLLFILFIAIVVIIHSCATSTSLISEYLHSDAKADIDTEGREVSPDTHVAKISVQRRGRRP